MPFLGKEPQERSEEKAAEGEADED